MNISMLDLIFVRICMLSYLIQDRTTHCVVKKIRPINYTKVSGKLLLVLYKCTELGLFSLQFKSISAWFVYSVTLSYFIIKAL